MLNIYRASAGSGKTFQLTKDYIFLLFDAVKNNPRPHRRILAVTFTNKATDEMKSRVLKELHALSVGETSEYRADLMERYTLTETEVNARAKKILTVILHDYSYFSISTIDKFFQQIVRGFAREIGVNGGYAIELNSDSTLQQALDNLYGDLSEKENARLLMWMTDFLQEQVENGKSWRVDKDILTMGKEIFKENYRQKVKEIREKLKNKEFLKNYRRNLKQIQSDFEDKVSNEVKSALKTIADYGITGADFSGKKLESNLLKIGEKKDYDLTKNTTIAKFAENIDNCLTRGTKPDVKSAIENAYNNGLGKNLNNIVELLTREIIAYNTAKIVLRNISTLGILSDLSYQVNKLTSEQNVMLLSDTNLLLNEIIDDSETPFIYERTGVNIDHYMIDEFQDTSALQWQNFKPLIANSLAEDKKNMLVGDVKQSIYRWRNSDWKLLDSKVGTDFHASPIALKTLETNWRSDRNIIHFNNLFFKKSSVLLQEKLNENIGENPASKELTSVITHAYSDIEQKVSKNAAEGYVQIQFIEKEGVKADWEQAVLEKIPTLLENLVDRGFKRNDIAFLVRGNKEATTLINFLMEYKNCGAARPEFSYDVVGNEGLMIAKSRSVNFITATFRLARDPKDDISRAIMQFEYLAGKTKLPESEAIRLCFGGKESATVHSDLFTEEENKCIETISHLSLFDAAEKLIGTFGLEEWYGETVFLQAFQDTVFKFANNANADMNSFLRYWDENREKLFIDAPENENAFKVMTIHKSKGLDFKVVIVPFCNWRLDASANSAPLLWCETAITPFSELPLMPIKYGAAMKNTIFQNEYFDEQMHQFVDNLNLAYVAFTRARNEMYCMCELPKPDKKEKTPFVTVADLLYLSLSKTADFDNNWNENENSVEIGVPTNAVYKEKKQNGLVKKLTAYPITDAGNRLKVRHASADYLKLASISESRINYGTVMHDILQKTIRPGDEEKAIELQLSSGKINEDDATIIRKELQRFWSIPEVHEWFSPQQEALNETTILLPTGKQYRPDRILLQGENATVIDYKFGEEERAVHSRQLELYSDFLTQMGYNVKSRLYYVSLGKIIRG